MEYIQAALSYFFNTSDTHSTKRRIFSESTFEIALRSSNFYLIEFLSPQSLITLRSINKFLYDNLTDELIVEYGKKFMQWSDS